MFLEISQKSQENACARVSFSACNVIAKETLALVFSCELWEISKNTFSYRTHLGDCFLNFNGNDSIILFNYGLFVWWITFFQWGVEITLIPEAEISKTSKPVAQLHSRKWLEIAVCWTLLRYFPIELEICSAVLIKTWR